MLFAPQQAPKEGRELRAQGCPLLTGTGLGDGWDAQVPPAGHTFNPPRRTGSLWLRGFCPSPTLGVAAKAKQSSPKEAQFGSLRKCYLWRAGWCEGEAGESCRSGSQTLG